jgi:NAD-dependent dihydropyrimidine dehydrogenase PreA subunit
MLIDTEACVGCGKCVPYCPMGAIVWHKKDRAGGIKAHVEIMWDECVECSVCYRAGVCPTDAIREEDLEWPRILRKAFSDPLFVHAGTDVPGRGTEEMKTNDVTGRFADGFIGIGMEFGRPGVGTRLREPEKAMRRLVAMGVRLEPMNPLTQLIEDEQTGALKREVLDEKVLSAIVECVVPVERAQEVLRAAEEMAGEIDTVFSLDVICKCAPDGSIPALKQMERSGIISSINGKVNVGLGRPLLGQ